MNRHRYANSQSNLQMSPIFHPRPRHQLRPPSLGMLDDLRPLVNNGMYFPSASSMTIPPPLLNEFSSSFLMGASSSYGMLPFPAQDPSRHLYMPSMDFGYGFPGGTFFHPPPSLGGAFLPSRQHDESHRSRDSDWNSQFQMHRTALQSRGDSFNHSLPTPKSNGKPLPKNGFSDLSSSGMEGSDAITCGGVDAAKPGPESRLPALPKLHANGCHPSASFQSPSSSHSDGIPYPPLRLPNVRPPKLSSPAFMAEQNEKRRNLRDNGSLEMKPSSHGVVENVSNDRAAGVIPKLPPLMIGNKDLARKLSEEEHQARRLADLLNAPINVRLDSGKFKHGGGDDHQKNISSKEKFELQAANDNRSRNLTLSGGSWIEGVTTNVGKIPDVTRRLTNDLSDIEVMRQAYALENLHAQQFRSVSPNSGATVSKHSTVFNLTSTPLLHGPVSDKQRRSSSSPSAAHAASSRSFVRPFSRRRKSDKRLSDFGCLQDVGSNRSSCPKSVATDRCEDSVSNSIGEPCSEEKKKASSKSDGATDGSIEIASVSVCIKQEAMEEVLDFTITSTVDQSYETPKTGGTVDSTAPGSRETAVSLGIPPQDCFDSSWLDEAVADQNRILDENGFRMPLNSSADLKFAGLRSPIVPGVMGSGIGDDKNGEFRCHLCNYSGRSQHCLNKHFRAHSQACKICRYCMKAFERPSDLVRHEERHQKRNHVIMMTSNSSKSHTSVGSSSISAKRRRPWFCPQCNFSCHEARKLIIHTRKMHPIYVECKLCRMKLFSEAELAEHKARRHPVAIGRIDTYWNGVVTATKLVTCEVTNDQEISVTFDEIFELPSKTKGIPEVSSLYEARCILSKSSLDKPGLVNVDHVGQESHLTAGMVAAEKESPLDLCQNSSLIDDHSDILDLSFTSTGYSLQKDTFDSVTEENVSTDPPCAVGSSSDGDQIQTQLSAADCRDSVEVLDLTDKRQPSSSKQTSISDIGCSELSSTFGNQTVGEKCSPRQTESDSTETLKEFRSDLPSISTVPSKKSKCKPMKLSRKVVEKTTLKKDTPIAERTKCFSKSIKLETPDVSDTVEIVSPTFSDAVPRLNCTDEIVPNCKIAKTEVLDTKEAINGSEIYRGGASISGDEFNKKCGSFICVRCKYSTNSKFKYQQHLRAHNGRFICKVCNKACIKSSDLYRHWVTHNVKGPNGYFACDSCDFTSPQKYVIENHMKQHYVLNPAQPSHQPSLMSRCGICQKNVLRSRLFEHKRVAHGKFFAKPRNDNDETDANGNSIKISPKTFSCPQCDRRFTTPSYLLRHHFLHHQEADSNANDQTKVEESACSCRFCGIKFDDVDLLHEHEINHILQTCSDTDYVKRCIKRKRTLPPDVIKTTPKPSAVKSDHSKPTPKKHSPRRKLSCPHCGKHFKMQYFLDQHMRIHSDERPFVCQWCGDGFAIFQYLNIHRRFKCPKCPNRKTEGLANAQKDSSKTDLLSESLNHSGPLFNQVCN